MNAKSTLVAASLAVAAFLAPAGMPVWFQGAARLPVLPGGSGGSGSAPRNHMPTSAFPHNEISCSVELSADPPGSNCSVAAGIASRRCSAYCDEGQTCSVFGTVPDNGGNGFCSALGMNRVLCSVLLPARQFLGESRCSAFNADNRAQVFCSVMRPAKKQFCSVENSNAMVANSCSTFTGPDEPALCSALNGGSTFKNFCSAGNPGVKTCSSYGGANNACSVAPGTFALCTNFLGSPSGSCSTQPGSTGHCSVIGGPAGNVCRQP